LKRKLALLNVFLAVLIVITAWRIRAVHEEAAARESATLDRETEPRDVAPPPAPSPRREVAAADYIDVAGQTLFSPDRTADVEIQAVAELPLPPLPVAHGILDLGSGPTAILSAPGEDGQRAYRVGETVGDFVLAAIGADELAFRWEGGVVRRSLADLRPSDDETAVVVTRQAAPPPKPLAQEKPKSNVLAGSSNGPSDTDMGGGILACRPGDTSPTGTVFNGYRKLVTQTPFGAACRWIPVE